MRQAGELSEGGKPSHGATVGVSRGLAITEASTNGGLILIDKILSVYRPSGRSSI